MAGMFMPKDAPGWPRLARTPASKMEAMTSVQVVLHHPPIRPLVASLSHLTSLVFFLWRCSTCSPFELKSYSVVRVPIFVLCLRCPPLVYSGIVMVGRRALNAFGDGNGHSKKHPAFRFQDAANRAVEDERRNDIKNTLMDAVKGDELETFRKSDLEVRPPLSYS